MQSTVSCWRVIAHAPQRENVKCIRILTNNQLPISIKHLPVWSASQTTCHCKQPCPRKCKANTSLTLHWTLRIFQSPTHPRTHMQQVQQNNMQGWQTQVLAKDVCCYDGWKAMPQPPWPWNHSWSVGSCPWHHLKQRSSCNSWSLEGRKASRLLLEQCSRLLLAESLQDVEGVPAAAFGKYIGLPLSAGNPCFPSCGLQRHESSTPASQQLLASRLAAHVIRASISATSNLKMCQARLMASSSWARDSQFWQWDPPCSRSCNWFESNSSTQKVLVLDLILKWRPTLPWMGFQASSTRC